MRGPTKNVAANCVKNSAGVRITVQRDGSSEAVALRHRPRPKRGPCKHKSAQAPGSPPPENITSNNRRRPDASVKHGTSTQAPMKLGRTRGRACGPSKSLLCVCANILRRAVIRGVVNPTALELWVLPNELETPFLTNPPSRCKQKTRAPSKSAHVKHHTGPWSTRSQLTCLRPGRPPQAPPRRRRARASARAARRKRWRLTDSTRGPPVPSVCRWDVSGAGA